MPFSANRSSALSLCRSLLRGTDVLWSLAVALTMLLSTTAWAEEVPPTPSTTEADIGDPQDALPPPDASSTFDLGMLCSRPMAPFAGALAGGALAGTTGLACIGVSAVTYTITAVFAIGGGGVLPLLFAWLALHTSTPMSNSLRQMGV